MALVWQKITPEKTYEVRLAGNSLRLYTDGTFHSQYNSKFPLSGSIWDLLVLPAFFAPENIERVLVLGVGGGAVICQLEHLLNVREVVGVELDPVHIAIAKKQFGLGGKKHVSLVQADAIEWLRRYKGKPFDLIIDDLFVENGRYPHRAVEVDRDWGGVLSKQLSDRGGLVVNFEGSKALRNSALVADPGLSRQFKSRFSLSVPGYDNRMAAFFREPVSKRDLSDNLETLERKSGKAITKRLTARVRKL